jgi:hypothetical protein
MTRSGFITSMSPETAMSPAFTSAGPVTDSWSRFGPSPCILSAICFTLRTMSVTSSRTPAREENSCSTFSILIEVIAAPCKRGEQHAAQRVAQRQTEAALQRLRHESRLTAAIAGGLDLQAVGLLQFLPVLGVDSHVFPLGMWREFWSSSEGNPGRCKSEGDASAAPNGIKIRRGGAWKAARRCAGSASHRGSM